MKWKSIGDEISQRGVEMISHKKCEIAWFCFFKWSALKTDYDKFNENTMQKQEKHIERPKYFREIEEVLAIEREVGTNSYHIFHNYFLNRKCNCFSTATRYPFRGPNNKGFLDSKSGMYKDITILRTLFSNL